MNIKIMLILTWVFYLINLRSPDDLWFFCLLYSGILTVCAFFYRMENADHSSAKRKVRK